MPAWMDCPAGHCWQAEASETRDGVRDDSLCPVCGAPGSARVDETMSTAPPPPLRAEAEPLPSLPGFEVLRELGRGGMGVVYLARQEALGRLVAVKVIRSSDWASGGERQRFLREARLVAQLSHPGIVGCHTIGEHGGCPYFAMEYVEGGSLAERLDGRPWPAAEAARFVERLARALAHAHERGIVHRDLKPANVLLAGPTAREGAALPGAPLGALPDGWALGLAPKVTDFGLAKRMEGMSALTNTGAVLGTPAYMAPEQAAGKTSEVGPATDVHALGVLLYELLTGRPPFSGEMLIDILWQVRDAAPAPVRRLRPEVPRELEGICLKCLAKRPQARYPTAGPLAEDLASFLERDASMPSRRKRRWLAAVGGVLSLALAVVAVLGWPRGEEADAGQDHSGEGGLVDRLPSPAQNKDGPPLPEKTSSPSPPKPPPGASVSKSSDKEGAPSAREPGKPELPTVEAAMLQVGGRLVSHLQSRGYSSIGVLKFLVSADGQKTSDSVGPLNLRLAEQLELALLLRNNVNNPLRVIKNASGVAQRLPLASHLSKAGRKQLFRAKYPAAWGSSEVSPDGFVTGVAVLSKDLSSLTIALMLVDGRQNTLTRLGGEFLLQARMEARTLTDAGESYLLRRGVADRGDTAAVASARLARQSKDSHPYFDKGAPVRLEILYDDKPVPVEYRDGKAFVPLAKERQKVRLRLHRDGRDETYGVVVKVNGENTIIKERLPDSEGRKWILSPKVKEYTLGGMQLADGSREPFRLQARPDPGALGVYYGEGTGSISMTVFQQRKEKAPLPDPLDRDAQRETLLKKAKLPASEAATISELLARLEEEKKTRGVEPQDLAPAASSVMVDKVRTRIFDPEPIPLISLTIRYAP